MTQNTCLYKLVIGRLINVFLSVRVFIAYFGDVTLFYENGADISTCPESYATMYCAFTQSKRRMS